MSCFSAALAYAESNDVVVSLDVAAVDEEYQDDYLKLVDHEAHVAMAEGDMVEARRLFKLLVGINPKDARALREYGRTSAALGDLPAAVEALGLCNEIRDDAPDPELHFIRGEALMALQQESAGLEELALAEAELKMAPSSRQTRLWQARIHALRKQVDEADAIYLTLRGPDPHSQEFKEVSLLMAEAYIMARKLDRAKAFLTTYAELHDGPRVRELLAWVLELRGDVHQEATLRETYSDRWDGAQAPAMVGYARSLERSQRYQKALSSYRSAQHRGNSEVEKDIARLENKISPEAMALGQIRNDPTGTSSRIAAGGMVYATERLRLGAVAGREMVSGSNTSMDRGTVSAMLGFGHHNEAGLTASGWRNATGEVEAAASAEVHSNPARPLRAFAMGSYNEPWTESTATLRNGASASSIELQLYTNVFTPRLVATSSGRLRALDLPAMDFSGARSATETFGSVGLDWIAIIGSKSLRGHSMDNRLVRPAAANEALVISYRHNELATDGSLGARIGLVERSTVDELSATGRTIIGESGVLALGATGGIGYDSRRDARLWRTGGELLISLSNAVRLTMSSELARETTTLFTGRRFLTQIGLHADL